MRNRSHTVLFSGMLVAAAAVCATLERNRSTRRPRKRPLKDPRRPRQPAQPPPRHARPMAIPISKECMTWRP